MVGSKGGKHSKGNSKSNSVKNKTSHATPEALNSKHNLSQTSNDKAQGLGDFNVKCSDPRNFRYTVNDLEHTDTIKDESSGDTSHCSIESSSKRVGLFKRINAAPALASQIKQDVPMLKATILRNIGAKFIEQQDLQNAGSALIEGSNLDSDILIFLEEECVKRWQESSPNDLKTGFIVDLIESIRDLGEKVKVNRQWAQKKVVDSAKRLSKDLLDLSMLKLEKVEIQRLKEEKLSARNSCMLWLKETEQSLRNVNCEASAISESIRALELRNAHMGADTEALKLSALEYGNEMNKVLNRELKCMKKLATIGKQTSNLRASCGEEKQKVLQLQQDVFHAEKEAKEAEDEWMQEIKEKERTLALLAEETRKAGPFKANLEAELSDIRQSIELDKRLKKDEVKWLERDLSRLRMFHQLSNVSLEGDTFLFDGIEVSSLEQNAPYESPRHWNCMICLTNEVSIVFLPCTHQVLCAPCYEGRCSSSASRQHCPYCGAEVQECIKAYAPC